MHGIQFDQFDDMGTRLMALGHVLRGSCFATPEYTYCGCDSVRRMVPSGSQFRMAVLNEALVRDVSLKMLRFVANALGMPVQESNAFKKKDHFLSFVQAVRDGFLCCSDATSILQDVETLPLHEVVIQLRGHGIEAGGTLDEMKTRLTTHLVCNTCEIVESESDIPRCKPVSRDEDSLLDLFSKVKDSRINKRPLCRFLSAAKIPYDRTASLNSLRGLLRQRIKVMSKGKTVPIPRTRTERRRETRRQDSEVQASCCEEQRSSWPSSISPETKEECIKNFLTATSSDALRELVCGVCGENKLPRELHPEPFVLTEPQKTKLKRKDDSPVPERKFKHRSYDGLVLHPDGVHDPVDGAPSIRICRKCRRPLSKDKMPSNALANGLDLGDVPECLKDLTVVEESMIARRRAKVYVVHLKESTDDDEEEEQGSSATPANRQRGFRGHIIVYPQAVENLDSVLPPPIKEALTPICVVFVGSKRPTKEWLKEKAKPLIIRREKV